MIDQELLIIAIIVITFINWVSTKLKERSARKKGITQELPQEESSLQGEPIEKFNKEQDFDTSSQEDLGFKDLIAAITGNEIPQQPEPVLIPSFESEEIITEPFFKDAEETTNAELLSQTKSQDLNNSNIDINSTKPSTHPVVRILKQNGGAKDAIVLAEVLGKPKSFQQDF
ncbi:MAG: hypothetical protein ACJ0IB_08075 [Verrucomicrobiales bacterium]